MSSTRPRFAFVTFTRVFDTQTRQEFATLPQLVQMFRRFEVRPQTLQRIDKELGRIEAATKAWHAGKEHNGATYRELAKIAAEAEKAGQDIQAAVDQRLAELRKLARAGAKRDLHLWSPAYYKPGSKRGKEGVVHVSCLVMDYDAGVTIAEATATWRPWFHMLHTTWSHTVQQPRFRMILPLAEPVLREDWPAVAHWAEHRTEHRIDPTGKSASSTFALPAVGTPDSPCFSLCQPGELLDPVVEGIVPRAAETSEVPYEPGPDSIIGGFAGKQYIQAPVIEVDDNEDPFESPDFWDSFHSLGPQSSATTSAPPVSTPTTEATPTNKNAEFPGFSRPSSNNNPEITDKLATIERLVQQGNRYSFVDALERLVALHKQGGLTDAEFTQAKTKLLADAD